MQPRKNLEAAARPRERVLIGCRAVGADSLNMNNLNRLYLRCGRVAGAAWLVAMEKWIVLVQATTVDYIDRMTDQRSRDLVQGHSRSCAEFRYDFLGAQLVRGHMRLRLALHASMRGHARKSKYKPRRFQPPCVDEQPTCTNIVLANSRTERGSSKAI